MKVETIHNPNIKYIQSLVGDVSFGNERPLTLTVSENKQGKWVNVSTTRNGSDILQNLNRYCWRLK